MRRPAFASPKASKPDGGHSSLDRTLGNSQPRSVVQQFLRLSQRGIIEKRIARTSSSVPGLGKVPATRASSHPNSVQRASARP